MIKIVYRVIGTRENRGSLCERDSANCKTFARIQYIRKARKRKRKRKDGEMRWAFNNTMQSHFQNWILSFAYYVASFYSVFRIFFMSCSLVRIFCQSWKTFFAATAHISEDILFLAVKKSEKEKERAVYTYAKWYIYVQKTCNILNIYSARRQNNTSIYVRWI